MAAVGNTKACHSSMDKHVFVACRDNSARCGNWHLSFCFLLNTTVMLVRQSVAGVYPNCIKRLYFPVYSLIYTFIFWSSTVFAFYSCSLTPKWRQVSADQLWPLSLLLIYSLSRVCLQLLGCAVILLAMTAMGFPPHCLSNKCEYSPGQPVAESPTIWRNSQLAKRTVEIVTVQRTLLSCLVTPLFCTNKEALVRKFTSSSVNSRCKHHIWVVPCSLYWYPAAVDIWPYLCLGKGLLWPCVSCVSGASDDPVKVHRETKLNGQVAYMFRRFNLWDGRRRVIDEKGLRGEKKRVHLLSLV